MVSIFGWLGAILIGISLGLLGSGGSILTVPVLYYTCLINQNALPSPAPLLLLALSRYQAQFPYTCKEAGQLALCLVIWFARNGWNLCGRIPFSIR